MLSLVRRCAPSAARAAMQPQRRILAEIQSLLQLQRGFASADSKWGITNDRITARVVNVVDDDGNMRTDVPLRQAIQEARA